MTLLRSASLVSMFTLVSRVAGLARELLIASLFGASVWTDAFNVAFRIPNLLRRLFAEGAFSQAFVPLLAGTRAREGDEHTRALVNAVGTILLVVMALVCVIGVIGAPALVWLMASGLMHTGGFDPAVVMTRWMFPYIGCMSFVALSAGVLNTWGRFAVPAATPVLLNVCVILAALVLTPFMARHGWPGVYGLAIGVMVGGVSQLLIQGPALARVGMLPHLGLTPARVRAAWHHPGVHRVLRQMAPAVVGVSVSQLSLLINTQIASHLPAGSVSWLTYADRLMEFPTSMLGVAMGVVLLPQLAAAQAKSDSGTYSSLLDWGLRMVVLTALPCAVALLVFTKPLVASLYNYGHFMGRDVDQTVTALMGYGAGLLGLIAIKVLAPGFYAKQDLRTPVRIAIVILVLTQAMNLVFVPWLAHAGLALSIGMGAILNAGWLLISLMRTGGYRPLPGWSAFLLRVTLACALLAAVLLWFGHAQDWVALRAHFVLRIVWLGAALGAAAVVYLGSLQLMGIPLREFAKR